MADSFFLKVRGWWQKVALRKGVFLFPLLSAFLLLTCLMRVTHSAGVERIRVISAGATSVPLHNLIPDIFINNKGTIGTETNTPERVVERQRSLCAVLMNSRLSRTPSLLPPLCLWIYLFP